MENRIRACRVVLTSGDVVMDYLDGFCMRGIAFAGRRNHNCASLFNCTQDDFEKDIQYWAINNKDNEDVEYIEFI